MPVDDLRHQEVRAAKFSIERSPDGVTLVIEAGELRLRFFIDGQFSDLIRHIHAGRGELGELVPFQMKPIPISALEPGDTDQETEKPVISTRTIGAHALPGLSEDKSAFDTPLWKGAFPSLRTQLGDADQEE